MILVNMMKNFIAFAFVCSLAFMTCVALVCKQEHKECSFEGSSYNRQGRHEHTSISSLPSPLCPFTTHHEFPTVYPSQDHILS